MLGIPRAKPKRLRIDRQFRLNDEFAHEILVKCPGCGGCAQAFKPQWDEKKRQYSISMSCSHCAQQHQFATDRDCWNSLPLWLNTNVCGEVLWALNSRYLLALQDFISACLRENKLGHYSNRHLYMSLPGWMTSKKNRTDLLRGLKRLRNRLGGDCV